MENIHPFRKYIGKKVKKKTKNPFKSQFRINTIKDIIKHPKIEGFAFTFIEDDSYVATNRYEIVKNEF